MMLETYNVRIEECLELDRFASLSNTLYRSTFAIRKFLSWEYYLKFVETAEFIDGN